MGGIDMTESTRIRVTGIDLLRVFAAVSVMVFHLSFHSWVTSTAVSPRYPEMTVWASWGWVGVQIFFVISGFVIAYSAANATWRSFAVGRFLRLAPALWICATITLLASALADVPLGGIIPDYIRGIVLWPPGPWIDPVYWTLTVELCFYLVVLALLIADRFAWLEVTMAVIAILSIANFGLVRVMSKLKLIDGHPLSETAQQLMLLGSGMHFALGVFLWAGFAKGWTVFRSIMVAVCLGGGLLPILATSLGKHDAGYIPMGLVALPMIVWLAGVAAMVAFIIHDHHFSKILSPLAAAIKILGLTTYPLYLIHNVVGVLLLRELVHLGMGRWGALLLSMAAMVVLALTVTAFLEPAVRRFLKSDPAPSDNRAISSKTS